MRNYISKIAVLLLLLMLTGCDSIDESIKVNIGEIILGQSGIYSDDNYKKYQELKAGDQLDEEDGYKITQEDIDDAIASLEEPAGIYVTFGSNPYLDISYYMDSEFTKEIDTTKCYLQTSDNIYGKLNRITNENTNLYDLSEYRIYRYDENGDLIGTIIKECITDGLVYQIPADFEGTDLSILPLGDYKKRIIQCKTFKENDNGTEGILNHAGKWSVNDEQADGNTMEISPVEEYVVKYEFDANKYFYVDASPEPFSERACQDGTVEFVEVKPTEETPSYEVELAPCLTITLALHKNSTLYFNEEEQELEKPLWGGVEWTTNNLRYGDEITIVTDKPCSIIGGNTDYLQVTKESQMDTSYYTLTITEASKAFSGAKLEKIIDVVHCFSVTLPASDARGSCAYKLDGEAINSGKQTLKEGQKLHMTYTLNNENYSFSEISLNPFDLYNNQRAESIEITENLAEKSLNLSDYFVVEKKED